MLELIKDTIRMRMADPKRFTEFRNKDIGSQGKLSMILGKRGEKWYIQSYRFNLSDYPSVTDVLRDANTIKGITDANKDKIASLTRKYFKSVNG